MIDPSHPLFGLRLPLLRVELRERLGRVCVVSIAPGLERLIPVPATNLGGCLYPTSPCRLSIAAIQQLLAVAAAVAQWTEEDAHAPSSPRAAAIDLPPDAPASRRSRGGALQSASNPVADVAAHQVWFSLSPALRADLRRAARRVLQEVIRDVGQC